MKHYSIKDKTLIMNVKKAPILIKCAMFLLSALFFIMPITGVIISIKNREEFHIGYIFMIGAFGLMGFYVLRVALWNTYGVEKVHFQESRISYEADYGWFKDKVKTYDDLTKITFIIDSIGYKEDMMGILIIEADNSVIECATKIPMEILENLKKELDVIVKIE